MKNFSRDQANALIPKIAPLAEELLTLRRDLAIQILECEAAGRNVASEAPRLAGLRSPLPPLRFGEMKSEIVRLVHRIEGFGCIVKDLDLGLIDFPALRGGRPIYLCWKAGEAHVDYWHERDEGFPHRKPV